MDLLSSLYSLNSVLRFLPISRRCRSAKSLKASELHDNCLHPWTWGLHNPSVNLASDKFFYLIYVFFDFHIFVCVPLFSRLCLHCEHAAIRFRNGKLPRPRLQKDASVEVSWIIPADARGYISRSIQLDLIEKVTWMVLICADVVNQKIQVLWALRVQNVESFSVILCHWLQIFM